MKTNPAAPWLELFPPPAELGQARTMKMRLLRKRGEPLLLLPAEPRLAEASLALYPAQTAPARIVRSLVRLGLQWRLPWLTTPVALHLDPASPCVQFLAGDRKVMGSPAFAMLFGNPHAIGRRFVLLLFDDKGKPLKLIKAGVGDSAVALIRREAAFLRSQPRERLQAPALRDEWVDGGLQALVLDYAPGLTPGSTDLAALPSLMESWIHRDTICRFTELPAAQRLLVAASQHPALERVMTGLANARLRPAIFHGDFTPWNVRVHPATRAWIVLDWERGETMGPPAWDWFHFLIQNEILVRRTPPALLVRQLMTWLNAPEFRRYAQLAHLENHTPALLAAYLLYCCVVVKQSEGQRGLEALLELHLAATGLGRS